MDVKLIALMITACICGSHKKENSLPPPSKETFADGPERYKYSGDTDFTYYSRTYGNINDGNKN